MALSTRMERMPKNDDAMPIMAMTSGSDISPCLMTMSPACGLDLRKASPVVVSVAPMPIVAFIEPT